MQGMPEGGSTTDGGEQRMANGFLRVIPATLVAVMLAAAGVLAQAKPG
jgi:hypothetical protein